MNERFHVLILDPLHEQFHALDHDLVIFGAILVHILQLLVKINDPWQESFVDQRGNDKLLYGELLV